MSFRIKVALIFFLEIIYLFSDFWIYRHCQCDPGNTLYFYLSILGSILGPFFVVTFLTSFLTTFWILLTLSKLFKLSELQEQSSFDLVLRNNLFFSRFLNLPPPPIKLGRWSWRHTLSSFVEIRADEVSKFQP